MPSFLSKLFRRKEKEPEVLSTTTSKGSKKSRKSKSKKDKKDKAKASNNNTKAAAVSDLVVKPTKENSENSPEDLRRPSVGTSNYSSSSEAHARVLSPRNRDGHPSKQQRHTQREPNESVLHSMSNGSSPHQHAKRHNKKTSWGTGPVDLDNSDLGSDTDENNMSGHMARQHLPNNSSNSNNANRLSVQQLHRFDMQQQKREATQQFYMPKEELPRFSAGHVPVDDGNRSDASSSSFNLSTDAEDTEYEALRRRGVVPHSAADNSVLDSSNLSAVSSPTNYNTDGDNSIFPALQTDDEGTTTERESQPDGILPAKPPTTSEDESDSSARMTQQQKRMKQQHNLSTSEDDEDARAWTISPNKDGGTNPFPFHPHPASPAPRRNFTSPKIAKSPNSFNTSALSTSANNTSNEFANFADFSNVTFPADTESWGAPAAPAAKTGKDKVVDSIPPFSPTKNSSSSKHRSSSSAAEMKLSDILAQARGKRGSSSNKSTGSHKEGRSNRHSTSSVNSAPAITAKYLRQHHNLRPARHSHDHHKDGTPVSDIIDSLEMANASRAGQHDKKSSSRSTGSRGAEDTARAAKERLRERRRREIEGHSSRRSDPNHTTDTSEGSDHEASETWLFDEVTGALGPRGIAADLESLSGRSKSSSGNKSHRSHRSHRSHGRSRRRKSSSKHHGHHHPSSGESVDSRGSRHSRNSRYSHRSTRSYLSQMSEQSRSVANDLLRLEMQLAMVGAQDGNPSAVPGSSASVTSRASRKSSRSSSRRTVAVARRNKVTIQAPSGKLGIILANKADSKGTVVSGVRSSSVLSEKISPGDRIVAIDGEDVSLMTVSEITTIMARKSDFERTLTVLTTPKHLSMPGGGSVSTPASPSRSSRDHDYQHYRYSSSGR